MHKKFEINRAKIKGGCQSGRKVVAHDSKSELPLCMYSYSQNMCYILQTETVHIHQLEWYSPCRILNRKVCRGNMVTIICVGNNISDRKRHLCKYKCHHFPLLTFIWPVLHFKKPDLFNLNIFFFFAKIYHATVLLQWNYNF